MGATLYFLLTGAEPGETLLDLVVKVATEDPPLLHMLPEEVQRLLAQMMAKDLFGDLQMVMPLRTFGPCAAMVPQRLEWVGNRRNVLWRGAPAVAALLAQKGSRIWH